MCEGKICRHELGSHCITRCVGTESLCLEGFVFCIDKIASEKANRDKRRHISLCPLPFP